MERLILTERQWEKIAPTPPASVGAKVLVLNQVIESKLSNAELARKMGTRPQEIQRIMNLDHATKIDKLEAVLQAIGKHFEFVIA